MATSGFGKNEHNYQMGYKVFYIKYLKAFIYNFHYFQDHPPKTNWNNKMNISILFRNVKSLLGRKLNFQNVLTLGLLFGIFLTYLNISALHNLIQLSTNGSNSMQIATSHKKRYTIFVFPL